MSDLQDPLYQDHLKLVESINRRVDSIYKQLCEFEEDLDPNTFDECDASQRKIMDLLDMLEDIQGSAEMTRQTNSALLSRQQTLEEQMKCLEQSVVLMKLETGKKSDRDGAVSMDE